MCHIRAVAQTPTAFRDCRSRVALITFPIETRLKEARDVSGVTPGNGADGRSVVGPDLAEGGVESTRLPSGNNRCQIAAYSAMFVFKTPGRSSAVMLSGRSRPVIRLHASQLAL
ncbi:hypothetical protein EYF80_046812 [Liparis tanakae]|uniref:Uncharacterized protein n=1 Tax=Liparis tanakae TaxID=230148 RepID=A0A4Z2FPL4_9TELE|nr:hypothetical protein EYF80_046812 [Liparis tanakae]